MEINSCKIKSVALLTVLARLGKKNCSRFIKNGIFRQVTWHLYRSFSLDQWIKSGKEACKLSSALLVEQLRIWKVFIQYGYCISDFSDLFPSLCIWLSVPTIQKLVDNDVMNEYCAIIKEAYLLVDVLAARLPNFYSCMHEITNDTARDEETWSWSQFGHIIDLALEWIQLKGIPYVQRLFDGTSKNCENRSLQDSEVNSFLWVISSVLNMLSSALKAVIPEDNMSLPNGRLPWLPDFIPSIGLAIIKNGYFSPSEVSSTISDSHLPQNCSILEYLCHLRLTKRQELAISSTCCLQGLVRVVASVDKLIQHANLELHNAPSKYQTLSTEDKVLANGILKSHVVDIRFLLTTSVKLISREWQQMQPVEMFGRGGPAPGVGVGWGAPGGGYWSLNTFLAQQDARLLIYLLETSKIIPFDKDRSEAGEMGFAMEMLNCALAACLIVGPGSRYIVDKLLKFIFEVPRLKILDFGIHRFLSLGEGYKRFVWNYGEEEYASFANVLATHFRDRWLSVKKKRKTMGENDHVSNKSMKKASHSLETIHEDTDETQTAGVETSSLSVEWAHQRLPLPAHWFLSAISTVHLEKNPRSPTASYKETYDFLEVAKGGLFFLLGIEAMPAFLRSELCSPVRYVPIVWKLHAMSVILLSGMGILEDEKSRDIYETLQNVYGKILDEEKSLQFEADIHENYSTFIETIIDQFAAES
ncbi:hypothetical protein CDL12_01509 [Handroanthus impetiginosus]|uniref:Uncharacterized protein n=1 Tax=Handroanthus impetiginosus TaxID=429701 RepID=A0A2G9I7H5_9LAMI|nr:hypothetical protein CDL12_01509 [Handroanthus impetiginosus]